MRKFVIYIRVSTQRQGHSGLGLDAQLQICNSFIEAQNGECVEVFKDVESGKSRTRQGLWSAIEYCKTNNCPLVIAKLDRLARDVEFTFKVINSGVEIHFCDMPMVNTMILGVFASVAQYERELISARTKAALDAKKARGEFWLRNSDTSKAVASSAISRREKARLNKNNVFLWKYMQSWEETNGEFTRATSMDKVVAICNDLNNRWQAKTSTGLAFNPQRLRAMYCSMKKIFIE